MKRLLSVLLIVCLTVSLAACQSTTDGGTGAPADGGSTEGGSTEDGGSAEDGASTDGAPFEGKIAIITNTVSQNEEEYRSAQNVVERYGADKVTHVTWPDNFMTEQEQMVSIVAKIASDPEVRALIINQAVPGTNAAVDKLLETRDDIFIVYASPQENPPDVVERANLILIPNELQMGETVARQAKELGADTLVHYSFPRHMSQVLLSARRDLMRQTCEELGITFVDATAPDPTGDSGNTGAQQFILEDVPKMVEQYGENTAFFSTNCVMQVPLIKASVDEGAIYPQPCCPSPFHGFPSALGIETGDEMGDIDYVVDETRRLLDEAGVLGRFSTWPVPVAMMITESGAEYAIKWINGEVPEDGLDMAALNEVLADYAGTTVNLSAYVEEDEAGGSTEYPTFQMILMDYLTY